MLQDAGCHFFFLLRWGIIALYYRLLGDFAEIVIKWNESGEMIL